MNASGEILMISDPKFKILIIPDQKSKILMTSDPKSKILIIPDPKSKILIMPDPKSAPRKRWKGTKYVFTSYHTSQVSIAT